MLKELVIASHNKGKIAEFENLLAPYGVKIYSAKDLDLPDVEETGKTFAENAIIKAEALAEMCNKPCLADDSGLCVDALDGRPGVYSARYAPNRDFDKAMNYLDASRKIKDIDEKQYLLGEIYIKQGEFDKAIDELNSLIAKNPNNIEYTIALANIYVNKKDYLKAREVLKKYLKNNCFLKIFMLKCKTWPKLGLQMRYVRYLTNNFVKGVHANNEKFIGIFNTGTTGNY